MKRFLSFSALVALAWSGFQLYNAYDPLHYMILRPLHVFLALALCFFVYPLSKDPEDRVRRGIDLVLSLISLGLAAYFLWDFERITTRTAFVDALTPLDYGLGVICVLVLLEASRRVAGIALTIILLVFIAYAILGPLIPGYMGHRGISFRHFIDLQFLSPSGIFTIPTGVSASIVFYFILFAAFLEVSGAGDLFIKLAFRLTGRARGGPAKAAVVASSLMGTVSGSAVANVAGTGIFTIPLMRKVGYSPTFAGAVEAAASTGGQLMPPIMGAAAFILAETIGLPYLQLVVAAILPAVIYYVSIYFMVDFQARRDGIRGLPPEALPASEVPLVRQAHLGLPLVVLVATLAAGYSLLTVATSGIVTTVVVSYFRRDTWIGPEKFLAALESGARKSVAVAVPSAAAGIVIGVAVYTGLGIKLTSEIVELSHGFLFPALFIVMVACLILGMGMPTSAAYIMAAILLGQALQEFGLSALQAHMFIFYFAILSMVTPPIALSAYAAAGISGASMWSTGIQAFKLTFAGFLIPYALAYNPALLLEGSPWDSLWVFATSVAGVACLAGSVIGHMLIRTGPVVRLALFAGSILLIVPELVTDAIGMSILVAVLGGQFIQQRRLLAAGQDP
ncbi:MAG: TRAP transporter fused permease subunit [Alphaproteobacteria bacterium]|jgi:TRAP transporter 4TM/12TM fusion protein|nr:TRAP transporter fused permease subunit [Alphaproteobacteria bacterium]